MKKYWLSIPKGLIVARAN